MRRIIIGVVLAAAGLASAVRIGAHDRISTTVTWDREIAPIVEARCIGCHAPGKSTMSLTTYEAARPWARAIRHQVLTRRMPVWRAARGYGDFLNDPTLSPFEISLIVAWADGGAPKTAVSRASKPAEPTPPLIVRPVVPVVPAGGRDVSVPCGESAIPAGILTGIRPHLERGGSVRVTALLRDGRREVIGWFRDFDPADEPTYWLRTPLALAAGARLVAGVTGSPTCSLALRLK